MFPITGIILLEIDADANISKYRNSTTGNGTIQNNM
jgi:hypothetical protein